MRAKHCLAWIVIRQRQLAGRRKTATLRTAAKVFAQIGCEHRRPFVFGKFVNFHPPSFPRFLALTAI
jgi:hypothetical protein